MKRVVHNGKFLRTGKTCLSESVKGQINTERNVDGFKQHVFSSDSGYVSKKARHERTLVCVFLHTFYLKYICFRSLMPSGKPWIPLLLFQEETIGNNLVLE